MASASQDLLFPSWGRCGGRTEDGIAEDKTMGRQGERASVFRMSGPGTDSAGAELSMAVTKGCRWAMMLLKHRL